MRPPRDLLFIPPEKSGSGPLDAPSASSLHHNMPTVLRSGGFHQARLRWLAVADAPPAWVGMLSPEELGRAKCFRFDSDREAYIAAHSMLRLMLAAVTGTAPTRLRFAASPTGKPILLGTDGGLHFSLAHSRRWVACAIAPTPLGVDVEASNRPVPVPVLNQLAPAEIALVRALSDDAARRAFYRVWALKEAVLKATGEGMSRRLSSFAVSIEPLAIDFPGFEPERWHLAEHAADPDHPVALAVLQPHDTPIVIEAYRANVASLQVRGG